MIPFKRSFSCLVVKCEFTLQTKSSTEWIFMKEKRNFTLKLWSDVKVSFILPSRSNYFNLACGTDLYVVAHCWSSTFRTNFIPQKARFITTKLRVSINCTSFSLKMGSLVNLLVHLRLHRRAKPSCCTNQFIVRWTLNSFLLCARLKWAHATPSRNVYLTSKKRVNQQEFGLRAIYYWWAYW